MTADKPAFLTTREVADLLRVKERKVYDLAAAGEIPHRRLTGKLLFPSDEIRAWIDKPGSNNALPSAGAPQIRPAVLAGSHDPLLDWVVREAGAGLATLYNGSSDGLDRFAAGEAAIAGLHIPDDDGWNVAAVSGRGLTGCVLIAWATRSRGLILSDIVRNQIKSLTDLPGHRVVLRQSGAGAAASFDRLLAAAGMTTADLLTTQTPARTEIDAAAAIATGEAEVAIGIEAMARQYNLGFLPLVQERFDLLIDRRAYFTDPVQTVLTYAAKKHSRDRADALGGYDLTNCGAVRWLSP